MSLKLVEFKNEQRAQHAVSVTHLKATETAIKALTESIRLGAQNVGTPAGGTPAAPMAAGGAAAAPASIGGTVPAADGGALPTSTMGGPTGTLPPGPPPGYAAMRGAPASSGFPPPAPVYGSVPAAPAVPPVVHRAGRLRVRNRDGSEAARAVSPRGRAPGIASAEWISEFGIGTVQYNGTLYRILPDYYAFFYEVDTALSSKELCCVFNCDYVSLCTTQLCALCTHRRV